MVLFREYKEISIFNESKIYDSYSEKMSQEEFVVLQPLNKEIPQYDVFDESVGFKEIHIKFPSPEKPVYYYFHHSPSNFTIRQIIRFIKNDLIRFTKENYNSELFTPHPYTVYEQIEYLKMMKLCRFFINNRGIVTFSLLCSNNE